MKTAVKSIFLIPFVLIFACAPHFNFSSKPVDRLAIYPVFPGDEVEDVKSAYLEALQEVLDDYEGKYYLIDDSSAASQLNIEFSKTRIAGKSARLRSLAVTAAGIAVFAYLIDSESPYYLIFWSVPVNNTNLRFDLSPDLEVKDKVLLRIIKTTSFVGPREIQIQKQMRMFKINFAAILKQIDEHNTRIAASQ